MEGLGVKKTRKKGCCRGATPGCEKTISWPLQEGMKDREGAKGSQGDSQSLAGCCKTGRFGGGPGVVSAFRGFVMWKPVSKQLGRSVKVLAVDSPS